MKSSIYKRTAASSTLLLLFTIASVICMELIYHNIGTVIVIAIEYAVVMGLTVSYTYRSLLDENSTNKKVIKKKIKIVMTLAIFIATLIVYYIQSLSPLYCKDLFSDTILNSNTSRMIVTLGMFVFATVTCVLVYMIMIMGYRVPIVDHISNENIMKEGLADRLNSTVYKGKTSEQVVAHALKWIMAILALVMLIMFGFAAEGHETMAVFARIVAKDYNHDFNSYSILVCIFIICACSTIVNVVVYILGVISETMGARTATICKMLSGIIKLFVAILMICMCLASLGIDTGAFVASAGILSIVIGFGSQELIKDIISGLFIIIEGEYRVGDIVSIGDFRGEVVEIGVRTTKLRDASNNVKIINNSHISEVVNMTKMNSYLFCDVGIEYGADLVKTEEAIKKDLHLINEHLPLLTGPAMYAGVVSMSDSAVIIRIHSWCNEKDRLQLERDFNREVKLIMDKNNINIPYPQVVVHNE